MGNDRRISGSQSYPVSESDISINHNDTSKIISAANINSLSATQGQFYSSDGGNNWGQTNLPLASGDAFHSDPTVDWTSDGTAWATTIGINSAVTQLQLRSYKSADGGASWTFDGTISGTQISADKQMMWIDHSPTSPFKDNIYVIWHNDDPVFVNRRTGPSGSWQTPIQVSGAETTGTGIGGDVKTNSFGDVFAFWPDTVSKKLFVAKSTNGGVSFSSPIAIATTFDEYDIGIPSFAIRRALIYISGAAYRTSTKNLVYAIWTDQTGASGCNSPSNEPGTNVSSACKTRIWFSRSTNGGTSWETAKMINNKASLNDQFNPRLGVDETNGLLMVIYYDTANEPGRLKTDVFMQTSSDDGVTWSTPSKITSGQTDETVTGADIVFVEGGPFGDQYGDYNGLSGHAGVFFPSWTDRQSGGKEEIWTAPTRAVPKACSFVVERSTYGKDEIKAMLNITPAGAIINPAFWVLVDGFMPSDFPSGGITSLSPSAAQLNSWAPGITSSPDLSGMSITTTPVAISSDDPSLSAQQQRFTFTYQIKFANDSAFTMPPGGPPKIVSLNASILGVSSDAEIQLINEPNPFITDGPTSWLSIDLRVFTVQLNQTKFGVMMGTDAPAFIRTVISNLTLGNGTAGGETFEALPTEEEPSSLYVFPTTMVGGTPVQVFNFAVARVRYRGLTLNAPKVRVFFRLFQAQTTNLRFNSTTTYRRHTPASPSDQPIPLLGIVGSEYVTIPFFAEKRIDSTTKSMDTQKDPSNVQDFIHDPTGAEVDRYYGCWLDINQTQNVLPITKPATNIDGPFSGALPIQQAIIRNPHQCLVAEIAFDPITIPSGATPSTSDKLAQRNLAWSDLS